MIKKLLLLIGVLYVSIGSSYAGVITHSDYTGGTTITAAGQNANENLIFNEFNGNIDNTNIKAGGILGTNLANNTIKNINIDSGSINLTNFNVPLISTVTALQDLFVYRRPVLKYLSATTITLETGLDGNSGEAAIKYPSGVLATETNATSLTMDITRNSGTSQGGLHTGSAVANTWYSVYAIQAPNIVLIADTITPIQASSATLDASYGHNKWVYLGTIRYGDASGATTSIIAFTQAGNTTIFDNVTVGGGITSSGVHLSSAASVTSLTYSYVAGTSGIAIPSQFTFGWYGAFTDSGASSTAQILAAPGNTTYALGSQSNGYGAVIFRPITDGVKMTISSGRVDLYLEGFVDGVLGVGSNPLL